MNLEISTGDPRQIIKLPDFNNPQTQEMINFGNVRVIKATNEEGCVDPRESLTFITPEGELADGLNYNPDVIRSVHDSGAERSPGGAFGKAMTLAAAVPELSAEQAVGLVIDWEKSEGRTFLLHEDDHEHTDSLGCGHIDRASKNENESLFGLPSEKVRAMRDHVQVQLKERKIKVKVPVLKDKHREKAVLVVLSDDKTVEATDGSNQFFRFDEIRHNKSLAHLAAFAQAKGINVTAEALKESAEKQRNAILGLLAAGLPIYEINLLGKEPVVNFAGVVSSPAAPMS